LNSLEVARFEARTDGQLFNSLFSRTTWVSRHQKTLANLDFNEARDMGWQWHQLDHMQIICTLFQTDNHTSTSPIKFLQARCSSSSPIISVKALKLHKRALIASDLE